MAEAYAAVRRSPPADLQAAHASWRATRDALFRSHPQTPLDDRQLPLFAGLDYFPYDPAWRIVAAIDRSVESQTFRIDLGADGLLTYTRIGQAVFDPPSPSLKPASLRLSLFWIDAYGGGLFLPFKDETSGRQTYGGGRYLYDTIKGADLGVTGTTILLDFNFAYNPSCAYHPRWVCPLSPPENALPFPVAAGEKHFHLPD